MPRENALRTSRKSGRIRNAVVRPTSSLIERLANLHLLLRAPSFARWPLELHFFAHDVYSAWREWEAVTEAKIPPWTRVIFDEEAPNDGVQQLNSPEIGVNKVKMSAKSKKTAQKGSHAGDVEKNRGERSLNAVEDVEEKKGIDVLDVTYAPLQEQVQKSLSLLAEGEFANCAVCKASLKTPGGMTLVCPTASCRASSHLKCLSQAFLTSESDDVLPVEGRCPKCKEEMRWIDLVKELSLRMRGTKEIDKLLKKPRKRKAIAPGKPTTQAMEDLSDDDWPSEDDDAFRYGYLIDQDEGNSLSDNTLLANTTTASRLPEINHLLPNDSWEKVIEDSEWDDAKVLD